MRDFIQKINKNLYTKIVFIVFLVFLFCFLFLALTVKYFISYSFLEDKFSEISGLKLEFVEAKSSFDIKFNLNTQAKRINIYNADKTVNFASIDNAKISFKPIGLIFNKLYFKNVSADYVKISIKRNTKGEVDIINSLNKELFKEFKKKKMSLTRMKADIKDIDFLFEDDYRIKNILKFNSKNSKINISKRKKILEIKLDGTLETLVLGKKETSNFKVDVSSKYPFNNFNQKDLKLNISLNNCNLFIFSDAFKKYITKDLSMLSGGLNLEIKSLNDKTNFQNLSLELLNPALKLDNGKIVSLFDKKININSIFDIQKDNFKINNLNIISKNIDLKLDGEIAKPFSKKPKVDLNLKSNSTQINNLFYFIPDNAIYYRSQGIPALKQSNFQGKLNGEINLKMFPLEITGNLKVLDVHIPNYPKSYRQNDVNLMFMKDKMRVYTRVYTPDNEYVVVDGVSNLDDSLYGKYSVKSTSKIDLSFARMYLVPIQQIVGFNIGPVPIMDMAGYGNIDIDTQGTVFNAQIFGQFEAYQASAKIEGLNARLTNGKCKLLFEDRNLIFKEIKGKLDGADFLLTGIGDTKGNVKLNAKINEIDSGKLLNIFTSSLISKPYLKTIKFISSAKGNLNADINLNGQISDYEDKEFLQYLLPSGKIVLKENYIGLNNNLNLQKLSGVLNFGVKQSGDFDFYLGDTKFDFDFNSNDNLAKISSGQSFNISTSIFSNKIAFSDLIASFKNVKNENLLIRNILSELENTNFYTKMFLKSSGMFSFDKPEMKNFNHNGYIIGLNSQEIKDIKFNSGIINIQNDKINFNDFDVNYKQGNIKAKGYLYNISQFKPLGDLILQFDNIPLEKIDKIIPKIKSLNGVLNKGLIVFKNDTLKINSFSFNYGSMPLFLNAKIKGVYTTKEMEADFSAILDEKSSDNVVNPYLVSPLKIVGEVPLKGSFKGDKKDYVIDFSAIVPKNSDISFSGANLGDVIHKRELQGKIGVSNNIAYIHNFKLIKYIANQNNKINPLIALKANGQIVQKEDNIEYENLKISTNSPINVRILNLLFKKSLLKKGNFDCNIVLNGDLKLPKVVGKLNFYDLDIPLYDTVINNVKVAISNRFIDSEILAQNRQSDVKINLHALNKLEPPYVVKDFKIASNKLDILEILKSIEPSSSKADIALKDANLINVNDVIVEKGSFDVKDVQFQNIKSQNLKGEFNYKNGVINLADVGLDIANGSILGNGKYNLKTTDFNAVANMKDCNSNVLAGDFLSLQNQIYGKINGFAEIKGRHLNTPQGIKNIESNINFEIENGKMPKLGSLEYLLRAGNLIKNGILGLSLNNIIEVLTPYKTGEFEKISGNLVIKNAEIETLNIFSQGKNLSMYLDGNYSILENFADIKIYGKLTQNISNALGALGNASISQFVNVITQAKRNKNNDDIELQNSLNKIPSIEIENPEPRYFKAKVLGDINKEDYIKSFDWI